MVYVIKTFEWKDMLEYIYLCFYVNAKAKVHTL